jgi:excisionase family DNA binding protein
MSPTMMTVEELAKRWAVSPRTIYGMIERREIAALRVGRLVRISRSHVETLEQQNAGKKAG